MPEPTSTAAAGATYTAAGLTLPALTAFGIPLGLRADVLIAGFFGSLVAIILLNSVPAEGDTWKHLVRTTAKRIGVAVASSVTAGYLTPIMLLLANLPDPMFLGAAFGVGGGAQHCLRILIARFGSVPTVPPNSLGGGAP
jgi:hypothetical protein